MSSQTTSQPASQAVTTGFHHVAVQVRDLSRAEAFYAGILGLAVLRRWPAPDGTERAIWLDLGRGAFLALERAAQDAPLPLEQEFRDGHAGWHLVALQIDPQAHGAWETRLAASGVSVVHRTDYTLYVRDPDGNRVGLSSYPEPAPAARDS